MFIKRSILVVLFLYLLGCHKLGNYVDNYVLGPDNAPKPEPLNYLNSNIKLNYIWQLPLLIKTNNNIYPIVTANNVYLLDTAKSFAAINISTKKIEFIKNAAANISAFNASNNYICAATDEAKILLFNNKGQKLWEQKISSQVFALPLITSKNTIVKTIDGNIYAFDNRTGNQIWLYQHGTSDIILKTSSSPQLINNRQILVGFPDGKIDILLIDNGQLLSQKSISYPMGVSDVDRLVDISADPLVTSNVVFLASYQNYLSAISIGQEKTLWQKKASIFKNLCINQGVLYFIDARDVIWAVDVSSGKVIWKQKHLKARNLTKPQTLGKYIILADNFDFLHVINKYDGKILANIPIKGLIKNSLIINGTTIYYAIKNGVFLSAQLTVD